MGDGWLQAGLLRLPWLVAREVPRSNKGHYGRYNIIGALTGLGIYLYGIRQAQGR